MAATDRIPALKRKLAAAGDGPGSACGSALRALRLGWARAAADTFDLPLAVIGARQARVAQEDVSRRLAEERLLLLLDGADGTAGALSLDAACVTALLQHQTMGRVSDGAAPARAFTGTDAALAAPLIDAALERAAALAGSPPDRRCLAGFHFGARAETARSLALALEAERFRVFDLTLEFAGGAQQGNICLILPDRPEKPAAAGDGAGGAAATRETRIPRAIAAARAELTAVIGRLRVPLDDLAAMAPGDILPLMLDRLDRVDLVTLAGHGVIAGRLGQVGGLRAIRVNETDDRIGARSENAELGFSPRRQPPPATPETMPDDACDPPADGSEDAAAALVPAAESEDIYRAMSPEEAAAEISELAGLGAEDADGVRPE